MELIIIYITFITIICMVLIVGLYFANSMINRNLHQRRLNKRLQSIRQLFDEHMAQPEPAKLSQSEIDKMRKLALTRMGLEAFTQYYSSYTSQNGFDKAQIYAARIVDYKILIKNYIVRNKYRASYILYLFAEYRLHSPETDQMAVKGLEDKSFYTRNNALNVIKNTGSVPLVIAALKVVSASKHYYNKKMIIDFFDTFTGDQIDLSIALLENFDSFSLFIKRLIPAHFTNQKISTQPVQDLMLRCLNSADKDLIISASKYFGWITNPRAGEAILRNLDHFDWEVRALSARVSQRGYENPQLLDVLERHLSDSNWFVRMNSAYAFLFMAGDDARVKRILDGNDKYAREMIVYVMFVKGMVDYKEYMRMTEKVIKDNLI